MKKQFENADSPYGIALARIKKCQELTLDLSGLGLTSLPPEIGQLKSLRQLRLGNNQLTSLPHEIEQLKSLSALHLNNNQFTSLPQSITRLAALNELNAGGNQLRSLSPEIGQFTSLSVLVLDNNNIRSLPPEIGKLTGLTSCYLYDNELTSLPSEIGQLPSLSLLSLHNNKITSLGPWINRLTTLTELYLYNNKLTSLPPEIGQLTALTVLHLDYNHLTSLPREIGQLTALIRLKISGNQLTSLLPEIGELTALTTLHLSENQLISLPPEISRLRVLKELDLRNCHLLTLPRGLRDLTHLQRIFLHQNAGLRLSPTILGPDPTESEEAVSAKSILDFYFNREIGKTRPLNEVKLILVGRGGAGKTSTVRALRGEPFRGGEDSTPGIALCDWMMEGCRKGPVTAHVWDFAGQVITHALHQFFFSMRSVYILVLTGRENSEREDAEYWLRLIKAFGTDQQGSGPPVIIALNKWDVAGCRPKVDRGALAERYPFVRGFVEVDCESGRGITKLTSLLCREVDRLHWVRDPFPQTWDTVRRALMKGKKRAHLSYADFRALCAKHFVADDGNQDSLAEILHNLGVALNYRNDPRLREATVLQPEWLTKNVYALMRRAEKQEGVLKQADLDTVLSKIKDLEMRRYLIRIMERFEIAYARNSSSGVWLVPQALPDVQPKGVEEFATATDATRLCYTYPALPEGLVARAIVRMHDFIEEVDGKKRQWASGGILSRDGARALIRTEPQDRQVMITVTGPSRPRQQLAGLCQAEMRDIHSEIRGLDPKEETQVEGTWVAISTLEADEKRGQQTGISTRERGTVMVDPAIANDAYSKKLGRLEASWKPVVFISYSKSNVPYRARLENELKILKNEGLIAGHWQDRMIDPGDTWDDRIQAQLADADVIIILASVDALATDYITEKEIPVAMRLHQEGQAVVVPVILEKCRWDKTELGTLNALPDKAKPLSGWTPRSNGWKTIADGLAKVFEKLIKKKGSGISRLDSKLVKSRR